MIRIIPILLSLSVITSVASHAQKIISFFDYWEYYSDHENALYNRLSDEAFQQLSLRKKIINGLETKENWDLRIQTVRDKLYRIIGPFPERTPLNPIITGKLKGDGFSVEKIIFESQPEFYVTAALFIPDGLRDKAPGIIYCSGHTFEGFRSPVYQHMIINLAKKGFVVLAFDPIGQGERLQYLDQNKTGSIFRTPTHEHSYPGGQCFITGTSLAKHMIWDGIRSIDYLVSRPEVDPERIGITGRSGGGTQSAYIAAMDPRIRAAAPECYITSFEFLFKSIGPQDAEQNIPFFLAEGLDHADLLEVRMPDPVLIISTTNDFFSIQGARDTYREVQKAYEICGYPDNIEMAEDDAEHASTRNNRIALYSFFRKHLKLPGTVEDLEITPIDPEKLNATTTGQMITSMESETIFSLNRKEMEKKRNKPNSIKENPPIDILELKKQIMDLTGYQNPGSEVKSIFSGREIFDQFILEKYLVKGKNTYYLPVAILKPHLGSNGNQVVIFSPEGKNTEIESKPLSEWLVSKGFMVILPDITGFGELGPGYLKGDAYMEHTSYNQWFAGILTGKSPLAIRMEDMQAIVNFIKDQYPAPGSDIFGVASDVLTSDLLHYNAISDDLDGVALIDPLISYSAMVLNKTYHPKYIQSSIYGSVEYYDLPDLAGFADNLLMVDIRNENGEIIDNPLDHPDVQYIMDMFREKNLPDNFLMYKTVDLSYEEIFNSWIK
jgi:dienelactone hydrolase